MMTHPWFLLVLVHLIAVGATVSDDDEVQLAEWDEEIADKFPCYPYDRALYRKGCIHVFRGNSTYTRAQAVCARHHWGHVVTIDAVDILALAKEMIRNPAESFWVEFNPSTLKQYQQDGNRGTSNTCGMLINGTLVQVPDCNGTAGVICRHNKYQICGEIHRWKLKLPCRKAALPHFFGTVDTPCYKRLSLKVNTFFGRPVLCDTKTSDGGWVVFQRRKYGNENFNRTWDEYKNGFGDMTKDFWLGLDMLYRLTFQCTSDLMIEFEIHNQKYYAVYENFHVGDENSGYALGLGRMRWATTGMRDDLNPDNGQYAIRNMKFSTMDNRNDRRNANMTSCSEAFGGGGWWFNSCARGFFNGNGIYQLYWPSLDNNTMLPVGSELKMRINRADPL